MSMSIYTVEKRKVSRTGVAKLGWKMGRGYVVETFTVEKEVCCILERGKVISKCRGKDIAEDIAKKLNFVGNKVI